MSDVPASPAPDEEDEGTPGYERTVAFSDGVFAIAITLLVLGIEVPTIPGGRVADELPQALQDLVPQIVSYFIGFGVIGIFWLNHHRFFSDLRGFDSALLMMNLGFLAFISLMPFTTGLYGRYGDEPIALAAYAANVAIASLLDTLMLWFAVRRRLLTPSAHAASDRALLMSLIPAGVFLLSIPVAFVDAGAAPWIWLAVGVRAAMRRARH